MNPDQIKALFDQQASSYDTQWAQTAPIKQCLYFLLESFFAPLPQQAQILCVGVGTGQEMAWLAQQHPGWQFTAVEPSGAMLEQCRKRAERDGFSARCQFHEGYLDSLPTGSAFDAATSFLVSQFILDTSERTAFFEQIASRLRAGGLLASADLAADQQSAEYDIMLQAWMQMMAGANITADTLNRMRHAYAHDVAVLPPAQVASLIQAAGFETPALFFQAGLIHAWCAQLAA